MVASVFQQTVEYVCTISKCRRLLSLRFVVATFLFLGIMSYIFINNYRFILRDTQPYSSERSQTSAHSGKILNSQAMEMTSYANVRLHSSNADDENEQRKFFLLQRNTYPEKKNVDVRQIGKVVHRSRQNVPIKGDRRTLSDRTNTNSKDSDFNISDQFALDGARWGTCSQIDSRSIRQQYQKLSGIDTLVENGTNDKYILPSSLKTKPPHVTDQNTWLQVLKYFPDLMCRLKRDFLPDYKNPCFLENGQTLCLPYFYLGGAPKCGTTDVWFNLRRHPDVFGGIRKEPHFWKWEKTHRNTEGYLEHFAKFAESVSENPEKRTKLIVGDGSASTLWANFDIVKRAGIQNEGEIPFVFADVIQAIQPTAKIIFILRDPTNRTISDHFAFSEFKSPQYFHYQVVSVIKQFKGCLQSRSLRTCANVFEPTHVNPRITTSVYIAHIREWLRVFPEEQILILRTEDWHYHKETNILQDVFKFLDIETLPENKLEPIANQTLTFLKLKQVTQRRSAEYGEIFPKTRKILQEFYAPYNKQLATFLNDDRFLWKT